MPIFFFMLAVGVIIIVAQFYFSKEAKVTRRLNKYQATAVNLFKEGEYGKIVGKIKPIGEVLRAPLSDRACVYFHIVVVEGSGKSRSTIIDEEVSQSFLLDVEGQLVYVKKGKVNSFLEKDRKFNSGTFNDAAKNLDAYLRSKGRSSTNFIGLNKTMKYDEGVLEPGEKVAVLGYGSWMKADQLGLQTNSGKILVVNSGKEPIYLSDKKSVTG